MNNCIPFANGAFFGPYKGFIYKNIPAFNANVGDGLAFDLGSPNDTDIHYDISLAPTTSNGGVNPAGAFTKVVSTTQTPLNARGDSIIGNFELQFTFEAPFSFAGGGLIIRFSNPGGAFATETTCADVLVYGNQSDPSGFFVQRFYNDPDGQAPWTGDAFIIGGFQLTLGETRTWDGGGTDNNWTTAANWDGDVAPQARDTLVFNGTPTTTNNDFAPGTPFGSIRIVSQSEFGSGSTGWKLLGNEVVLGGPHAVVHDPPHFVSGSFENLIALPIRLASEATFRAGEVGGASSSLRFTGPIATDGHDIVLSQSSFNPSLSFTGSITGSGGLRTGNAGHVFLAGSNSYSGQTEVNGSVLWAQNVSALGTTTAGTVVHAGTLIPNANDIAEPVTVDANGTLSLNNPVTFLGDIALSGTLRGAGGARVSGAVRVASSLAKIASYSNNDGGLVLAAGLYGADPGLSVSIGGTDSLVVLQGVSDYAGTGLLLGGTLQVDGTIDVANLIVQEISTLSGTGTTGTVVVNSGGTVAPGASSGILNSGSVSFAGGSNFIIDVNGPAVGTQHDQLSVTGSVSLSNADLNATGAIGLTSESIIIINNDGTDTVIGTFNGLPQGATVTINGLPFVISYVGGDGNDVTLTRNTCVTNTNDSGPNSLRQAILDANANPGSDNVCFDIAGPGPHMIHLLSALPTITDPVVIDGTTEPDFAGSPVIELDGSNAGVANGLRITADGCTVKGLVINRFFGGSGIILSGSGTRDNVITGNYIGTDVTGTLDMGNSFYGVMIELEASNNTVGGASLTSRNIISGNNVSGVYIVNVGTTNNVVSGNYIGTDVTGDLDVGNSQHGIYVEAGGSNTVTGNVVSGNNARGVVVGFGDHNLVAGNIIGLNAAGTAALGNGSDGIYITSSFNTIGGTTPADRNLVSGNVGSGVRIEFSGRMGNVVAGNHIGTDTTGTLDLGNGIGVKIDGAGSNTIGGTAFGARNVISGNSTEVYIVGNTATGNLVLGNYIGTNASGSAAVGEYVWGVRIDGAAGNRIGGAEVGAGNVISGSDPGNGTHFFPGYSLQSGAGIIIHGTGATGNVVSGNHIGTDAGGSVELGNDRGVEIVNAPGNVIGGTEDAARNVISGNSAAGVKITGNAAIGNSVLGNYIGTNALGTAAVRNTVGVIIDGPANTVGGVQAGARNVISGNGAGISISGAGTGTQVLGNYIGTNALGTAAIRNQTGVGISSAGNTIGGTDPGAGNVISGNGFGVIISGSGATENLVLGNYIGTNASGTARLANGATGVLVSAPNNTIGGTSAEARNIISGNEQVGVDIRPAAFGTHVLGNYIGTDVTGATALGNLVYGVNIAGSNNLIGGEAPGAGNVIAFNGFVGGVAVGSGTGNTILSNSIHSNSGLGIDLNLNPRGVTLNDLGDPDTGPNNLQNFPMLTAAFNLLSGGTQVSGIFNSAPDATFKLQFFYSPASDSTGFGEGKTHLGTALVTTDSGGSAGFSFLFTSTTVPVGQYITATATDESGNTSEFSNALLLPANTPPTAAAGGSYTVGEGESVSLSGSGSSDPNQATGTLTFAWDLDGDGIYGETGVAASRGDEPGIAPTFSAAGLDGPSSVTIGLRVTDAGGLTSSITALINVTNLAPQSVNAGTDQSANEGDSVNLSGTFTDPGTADTHTQSWSVVASNGQVIAAGSGSSYGFTPSDNGTYTVTYSVTDDDGDSTSDTVLVMVTNVAPQDVNAGTDQTVAEGTSVSLSGSFTDPGTADTHTQTWSVVASNGQVIAAGSGPSYTFTPDNNGTYMVTYSVTDDDGDSSSDTITINVNNVAPTVSFTGPASGVRGQTLQFVGSFSDPGADAWTATVDFGDGSSDQPIVLNPDKSFGFGHAYTSSGSYTVTVTVQDGEPGGIGSFSRSLTVSALAVLADSCCAQALFVGGSTGADNLLIRPGNLGSLVISINSVESTIDPIATPFGRIVIFAQAGNDDIQVAGSISIPITARGGAGDDRLKGGDGNDILLGEEGDDLVVGGQGRDLLIGGVGADRIVGNADDDILIAGRTSFDSIDSSLCAIMAEWTSAAGYNTRVAHLRGDISSGLNGSILLNDQTVHDDAVEDILTGSSGQDWFLFNQDGDGGRRDRITDLSASEFANDIDFINGA